MHNSHTHSAHMHLKCISNAYEQDALFPYAFEMHFKCIMAHMHIAVMHISHMRYSDMHLKCISNAYENDAYGA